MAFPSIHMYWVITWLSPIMTLPYNYYENNNTTPVQMHFTLKWH